MSYGIKKINVDGDHWVRKAAEAVIADAGDEATESMAISYLWGLMSAQFTRLQDLLVVAKKDRVDTKDYMKKLLDKGILTIYLGPEDKSTIHRYQIATISPYKGSREEIDPTTKRTIGWLRNRLISKWKAIVVEGMETDDKVSIESKKNPEGTLTISNDKDDRQSPGWWWWWDSSQKYPRKPYLVDPRQYGTIMLERTTGGKVDVFATGEYMIAYQMLVGDEADNIPGVEKGYGPVKAYNFLRDKRTDMRPLEAVVQLYRDIYGDEQGMVRATEIFNLLKMLDAEPKNEKES